MKCLRCGEDVLHLPALSRRDNNTDICNDCGMSEAVFDMKIARFRKEGVAEEEIEKLIKEEREWLE